MQITRLLYYGAQSAKLVMSYFTSRFFFFIIASFTEQQYTHIYICDIDRATWTKTVPRTTQMNVCVWVLVYTLIGFLKLHIQAFMLAGAF